ncbi:FGGY-family carbohydrate kinase [Herbiconiux moechotypicola]|uniref:FGGY-family carbohydrate kinase n=1 Tax=Herbiconiux moechotypicola TaxID=637393 RepID=A0ABN3DBW8_9MICO|nr:FGGY-family carbohydrate kinase [Herbiconiux moechotypicola]MCS5728802.1 FGGY-family carbohydrate kinase [Herbiconiux moechotypicola]
MTVVLGIDLATADVRVQAVDVETGAALAERKAPLPVRAAGEPGAEPGARQQPARHGDLARDLVAAVAHDLGGRAREVRALSITGTSGTVVPADDAGRPLGDAVLYDDPRGAAELRRLAEAGLTRRPLAALARASWMHTEAVAQRAPSPAARALAAPGVLPSDGLPARYLFTPDIVAAALAGRLLPSDTSHALKSGIDPVTATWDDAALAALDLPREVLPDLLRPGTVIGEVADPGTLGLPEGVLIVAGMTDGSTGQIATGAVAAGDTVGVLGTTLVLKAVSAHEVIDTAAGIYSHGSPDGLFWPGGASNTGAGVLRTGLTEGIDPADPVVAAAIEALGPAPVVTYPLARRGERFPVADPAFAGFSADLHGHARDAATPVERFRAVFEGVAFVERLGLERLAALGVEQSRHHLAGGTSASALWNRIRASALACPVVVVEGAGSVRGAAALAASALPGAGTLAEIAERFSGVRTEVDPDERLSAELERRYLVFCERIACASGGPIV